MVPVVEEVLLGVVDGHATVDAVWQGSVLHDRDTLVGAIGVLEEHDGGPVVGEVLGECARGAGAPVSNVAVRDVHGGVEDITTDDLVKVGRRDFARLDEGVDALDAQGRAAESEGGLGGPGDSQRERKPLHLRRW